MKKNLFILLLGTIGLQAMQPNVKGDFRNRLTLAERQLKAEAQRQVPNFQELQAHTLGLITIRTQIYQHIPIDEQQKIMRLFQRALPFYKQALGQAAVVDPAAVAQWLTNNLAALNANIDDYEAVDALGKARLRNELTILNIASDAIAQYIDAQQRDRQAALANSIREHIYGEVVQNNT